MKTIAASREPILARPGMAITQLLRITTYTNRASGTVRQTFNFGERYTRYAGVQWLPFLAGVEVQRDAMTHLPPDVHDGQLSGLRKRLTVRLRNGTDESTGDHLIKVLRSKGLEGSAVELWELPIDRQGGEDWSNLTSLAGNEHLVRFRGNFLGVDSVSDKELALVFETREPQLPWKILSDASITDPLDLGKRENMVFGAAKRVPCNGQTVGSVTTVAASITTTDTSVQLTDATGFGTSGEAMIGEEKISWAGKSGNTLTSVTRGAGGTTTSLHSSGAVVVELVTTARFSFAGHKCSRLNNLYALSPFTNELHRITTPYTANPFRGWVEFSSAQLVSLLDDLATAGATVTQQPSVSTQPAVSHPVIGTVAFQQTVAVSTSPAMNDGNAFTLADFIGFQATQWWSWNPPGAGSPTITSQTFNVVVTGSGQLKFWSSNPFAGIFDPQAQLIATLNPAFQNNQSGGTMSFQTTIHTNQLWVSRPSGNCLVGEATRTDVQFNQQSPTLGTSAVIAATDPTQVKVRGESVGFGLRLYADVDGVIAPIENGNWTNVLSLDADAANWTSPGGTAQITNDTSVFSEGSGSLKLTANTTGAAVARRALPTALNLSTGQRLRLKIRIANANQISSALYGTSLGLSVALASDSAFANVRAYVFGGRDGLVAGQFVTVEIDPLSADSAAGSFNVSAVTHIQLFFDNLGAAAGAVANVDSIQISFLNAASTYYTVNQGSLLETAPDIARYVIAELAGLGHDVLDSEWNEAADSSHLNDNKHAAPINFLGDGFSSILARLAYESRANIVLEERLTGQMYRFLVADKFYRFGAPSATITEWRDISESSPDSRDRFTRFRTMYDWDASIGDTGEAFRSVVRIDPELNQATAPSTQQLTARELVFGRRDAPPVLMFSIRDQATALEVAGYYAAEQIREIRLYEVSGVPWTQAFLLERGDIVHITPPWESGSTTCRVVDVTKDPRTQLADLKLVEVPSEETVALQALVSAELTGRATAFVEGTIEMSAALAASIASTANARDITVLVRSALSAEVISTATAFQIGHVPMSASLTATLDVSRAYMNQFGTLTLHASLSAALSATGQVFDLISGSMSASLTATAKLEETNRFLGGLVPSEAGYYFADGHSAYADLDGSTEYFQSSGNTTIGIANSWFVSIAFTPTSVTSGDLLEIAPASGNANLLRVYLDSGAVRVVIYSSGAAIIKDYSFGSLSTGTKYRVFVRWTGSALNLYLNGVDQTATTNTDTTGTMTDTSRHVTVGSGFTGKMYSAALWSTTLGVGARAAIWNSGSNQTAQLTRNWSEYIQARSLQHWWRFGHDLTDIGKDYTIVGTPMDLMAGAANISTADIGSDPFAGASAEFDGSTEYLANNSFTALGLADSFTIAVWARPIGNGSGAGGEGAVFACDSDDGNKNRILIQFQGSGTGIPNSWLFQVSDGTPNFGGATTGTSDADVGEWQHVVGTKNGSTCKLYINGVLRMTSGGQPTTTNAARQVTIGASQLTTKGEKFNGRIFSVIAWDVALSDASVRSLFNGGMKNVDPYREHGSYTENQSLKHFWYSGPVSNVGVGSNTWTDRVSSGGINLETNAANMTTADIIVRSSLGSGACLEFNGASAYLANNTPQALGFGNAWTWEGWLKCDTSTTGHQTIFDTFNGTAFNSRIAVRQRGDLANDPFQVNTWDSAGVVMKSYTWNNLLSTVWAHVAVTWDGSSLLLYKDGVAVSPDATTANASSTMADDSRVIRMGASSTPNNYFDGRIARVSIWSSTLSADQVRQVYTRRLLMDLRGAFGAYTAQANLVHQWILGARYPGDNATFAVDLVDSGGIDPCANDVGFDVSAIRVVGL